MTLWHRSAAQGGPLRLPTGHTWASAAGTPLARLHEVEIFAILHPLEGVMRISHVITPSLPELPANRRGNAIPATSPLPSLSTCPASGTVRDVRTAQTKQADQGTGEDPPLHPTVMRPGDYVKIGTGIGTIPAWVLIDSIAIGRWPVRGCAWADRKDAESWVVQ